MSRPREIDPTNFNVETPREAMASDSNSDPYVVSSKARFCCRNKVIFRGQRKQETCGIDVVEGDESKPEKNPCQFRLVP